MSRRLASAVLAVLFASVLSACCKASTCIKDPPCKPCGADAPAATK